MLYIARYVDGATTLVTYLITFINQFPVATTKNYRIKPPPVKYSDEI